MRKWRIPKKNLKHATEARKTMLKKLSDPDNKDDPEWVKANLGQAEARISKKEKAQDHRESQRNVGQNRRNKESLD